MRSLIYSLVILIPWTGVGQTFQNICSPDITFFKAPDGYIKAFRQDSVYLSGGNDTIFLSYRAIRDTVEYSCRDTSNGSLLGLKVCKKNDGTFFFFNRYQDTLRLITQAGLNQSWNFFSLGNGSWIEAKVTQLITDSVLGLTDQVKVITFQAKDASNQNIPHLLNGKEIRLSQHYGLSLMYDAFWFPSDTLIYTLCGKTSLSLGLQDISWTDIYNFDVGDEFHFFATQWFYPYYSHQEISTIKKVLSKEIFGNNDSVAYHVEYCSHSVIYTNQGLVVQNNYDTIVEGYNFINLSMNPSAIRLPEEFSPGEYYYGSYIIKFKRSISGFGGRTTQEMIFGDYYTFPPPCWGPPFESFGTETYTAGLGQTYFYYGGVEDIYSGSMVYFKKGTEIWGTPLAPDCSTLVPVNESIQVPAVSVEIIPNPVLTIAEVRISGIQNVSGITFCLLNELGKKVRNIPLPGNSFTLNCEGLHPGLYLYILNDPDGSVIFTGKVILK